MDISFNSYQSYVDWGLRLKNITISFPEVKKNEINIPGMDGTLDLTEYLCGDVNYDNRTIQFTFDAQLARMDSWSNLISNIANAIHGKRVKIINFFDKNYYYIGRVSISTTKSNELLSEIVIDGVVDPFKYELNDGSDPWLWDPFSFKDGIIRNYYDISVTGSTNVRIIGRRKRSIPTITCNAQIVLTYKQTTIHLPAGKTKVYELQLGEGEHILTFTGTGMISISYQGGSL